MSLSDEVINDRPSFSLDVVYYVFLTLRALHKERADLFMDGVALPFNTRHRAATWRAAVEVICAAALFDIASPSSVWIYIKEWAGLDVHGGCVFRIQLGSLAAAAPVH